MHVHKAKCVSYEQGITICRQGSGGDEGAGVLAHASEGHLTLPMCSGPTGRSKPCLVGPR